MATSAVPGAIDALLGILRAASALSGVLVIDGPPIGNMEDADLVAVGWSPASEAAVEMTQTFASAGARTRDEDFFITCWAESWSGDTEAAPRRARAFELLAAVEDAIRATGPSPEAPTLNGAVLWSHLTRAQLQQFNTEQGLRTGIAFTVSCRARI